VQAAALNLDGVCRTAGPSGALKRIVPVFLRLCADDIWGVRKACAESLISVSKCLDPAVRVSELIPVFERFAADSSKWVRNAAYQHLGPFLATLPGAKITPALLSHYVRMGLSPDATGPGTAASTTAGVAGGGGGGGSGGAAGGAGGASVRMGNDPNEAELAVYCAFSFPAVVLTLGRTRWPELRPLWQALTKDPQRKVRRPLSHSLHEVARILGPDLAEAELLPTFELYLKDADEVKVGVVRNLAAFLAALSPTTRESYLPVLDELLTGTAPLNWRFRKLLAAQVSQLAAIFSPAATFSVVTPLAFKLLTDPVASVREEVVPGLVSVLNRLAAHDATLQSNVLERLTKLAGEKCYRERLLFVHLATAAGHGTTGINHDAFRRTLLPNVLRLANDPVSNVRLAAARMLAPLTRALVAAALWRASGSGGYGAASVAATTAAPSAPAPVPAPAPAPALADASHAAAVATVGATSPGGPQSSTPAHSGHHRSLLSSVGLSSLSPSSTLAAMFGMGGHKHAPAAPTQAGAPAAPAPGSPPQELASGAGAGVAVAVPGAEHPGRPRTSTDLLPPGVDDDNFPLWARAVHLPHTEPMAAGDGAAPAASTDSAAASEGGAGAPTAAVDILEPAEDVVAVLTALCNDTDEEVVRALDPRFVAPRRTVETPSMRGGAAGTTALATSAAGGSTFHTSDSDAVVLTLGEPEGAASAGGVGAGSGGPDDFTTMPSVFNDPDSVELSLLRQRVLRGEDEDGDVPHRRNSGTSPSALSMPQPIALGPGLSDDAGEGGGGWVRDVVDTGLRDSAAPATHAGGGASTAPAGVPGRPPLARGDSGDLLHDEPGLGELVVALGGVGTGAASTASGSDVAVGGAASGSTGMGEGEGDGSGIAESGDDAAGDGRRGAGGQAAMDET